MLFATGVFMVAAVALFHVLFLGREHALLPDLWSAGFLAAAQREHLGAATHFAAL